MITNVDLKPGENWINEHLRFECKLASGNEHCTIIGLVLDRHTQKPTRPMYTKVKMRMPPDEAIKLALAISKEMIDNNIPLPKGVLVTRA